MEKYIYERLVFQPRGRYNLRGDQGKRAFHTPEEFVPAANSWRGKFNKQRGQIEILYIQMLCNSNFLKRIRIERFGIPNIHISPFLYFKCFLSLKSLILWMAMGGGITRFDWRGL